ncbi:hypothetical protein [Chryseobacterium sp. AG363]|uniref:hypothetical protein n=1 Tax=Chryseobacterium sp. AG363 TaxID=2183997 RepID=UPI000E746F3E|nr:hypothetical protein [Chryseobacterium sp. AG363]RKE77845.1 hypothetical protein DEU39_3478 [Chryseobacterium sp. AG363]
MKNIIGEIRETKRDLNEIQIKTAEDSIKEVLQLKTVKITKTNKEVYLVSTDDDKIIDFNINQNGKVESLIKYITLDDDWKEDKYGATLTYSEIKIK